MKVTLDKYGVITLTEVYNPIKLITNDGEVLRICMRDSGFELNYQGTSYEAKDGDVRKMGPNDSVY